MGLDTLHLVSTCFYEITHIALNRDFFGPFSSYVSLPWSLISIHCALELNYFFSLSSLLFAKQPQDGVGHVLAPYMHPQWMAAWSLSCLQLPVVVNPERYSESVLQG